MRARPGLAMTSRVFTLMRVRFMFGGMAVGCLGRHFPEPFDMVNIRHIGFDIAATGGHVVWIEALPLRRCMKSRTYAGTHRVNEQFDQRVRRASLQRAIRSRDGGSKVKTCWL